MWRSERISIKAAATFVMDRVHPGLNVDIKRTDRKCWINQTTKKKTWPNNFSRDLNIVLSSCRSHPPGQNIVCEFLESICDGGVDWEWRNQSQGGRQRPAILILFSFLLLWTGLTVWIEQIEIESVLALNPHLLMGHHQSMNESTPASTRIITPMASTF